MRIASYLCLIIVPLAAACSSDDTNGNEQPEFERPQILPRLSPVCISEMDTVVGMPRSVPWDFTNRGEETLVIDSIMIAEDERNAFSMPNFEPNRISFNEFGIVQFTYDPPSPGWDAAYLEVRSNAENFPLLRVFLLGRALPNDLDAGTNFDAGPKPDEAFLDDEEACP